MILPTETVYGIAADPRAPGAVERLFEAKGRGRDKPIPLLADHERRLRDHGAVMSDTARRLAKRFWPGPLTLVLPAGDSFEGFRIPDHRVTLAVLKAARGTLRVTSANRSGAPDAHTVEEALEALGPSAAVALDAGPSPLGAPSTVVRVRGRDIEVLREGALSSRQIRDVASDHLLLFLCSGNMCRSPMAEYLMREWLGQDSVWSVQSAGVSAGDGLPASWEAVQALRESGIDLLAHRSRRLTRELVDAARVIVVMTDAHRAAVLERFPDARERVRLLGSFGPSPEDGDDVGDPIGSSLDVYRRVRDQIRALLPNLVLFLHERAGTASPPAGKS